MDWKSFQDFAGTVMGNHFNTVLSERQPTGCPKKCDYVSPNGEIVGDAKYLTLVDGHRLPPAKFMEIAGHVWLLEKTPGAKTRFLVFGNQRRVSEWWLEKYGGLNTLVQFYFLCDDGTLEQLV
nr:hypothetical protein [candidate division Zixibacteria bacterium]